MTALPQSRAEVRLPFAAWPEQDRIAWEGLFIEGDLFDETGGAAHWRPATRESNQRHYARWLK